MAGILAIGMLVAGSSRVRAAAIEHSIVITQLPRLMGAEQTTHASSEVFPPPLGEGARIAVLSPQGSVRVLTEGFHSACEPDVHFDGERLLFAGKRSAEDAWNIFEIGVDGSGIRQITRGRGDCRSPGYQSDYYQISDRDLAWQQITFVGTRAGEIGEYGSRPATSLYSCKLDGTNVRRLTFNLSNDSDPHLMWDGRLIYASWLRRTLAHGLLGRVVLLGVNTDGTDYAPFVVDGTRRFKHMPCSTETGLLVFVEMDDVPWDRAGMLSCVQLRRPLHTYRSITGPQDGLFHSPSPLPDGTLLVSRRAADGSGTHGVYHLDPTTTRIQQLYDDPRFHEMQPKLISRRKKPDGRSSSVVDSDARGRLYCLSVYNDDLPHRSWMPPGAAKKLRVVEGIPRRATDTQSRQTGTQTRPRLVPRLAARRILGEVAVAADGSFNVEVPANTPIELQLLDEQGVTLRSCGWIWTRNHFNQGCIGCHEDPELTPENTMVDALERPSSVACPPVARRETVDFRRDLMPIITAKCLPCHATQADSPRLTSGEPLTTDPAVAQSIYDVLLEPVATDRAPPNAGRYVVPGQARTSPLIWHLLGQNLSRPWDGDAARASAKPIPGDTPHALDAAETSLFVKWIDLGAPWGSAMPATSPPRSQ
jgi:hypothetical protein